MMKIACLLLLASPLLVQTKTCPTPAEVRVWVEKTTGVKVWWNSDSKIYLNIPKDSSKLKILICRFLYI